jgi:hypothetical protein
MKRKKPAFLKTFSEFTIQELRVMPVGRVISLFFQEVGNAIAQGPEPKKRTAEPRAKKNAEVTAAPVIVTARIKKYPSFSFRVPAVHPPHLQLKFPTASFHAAMKRVFIPNLTKRTGTPKKVNREKNGQKSAKQETVVFHNPPVTQ